MTDDECFNTFGSYICICPDGLARNNETGLCEDIDECGTSSHRCQSNATCLNEYQSYDCECPTGYTGNGYFCLEKEEQLKPCGYCDPNQVCAYDADNDKFKCVCGDGYNTTSIAPLNCEDINECLLMPCTKNQTCINYPGGYKCDCKTGYQVEIFLVNITCITVIDCNLYYNL